MKKQKLNPHVMRWLFQRVRKQIPLMIVSILGNIILSATLVFFALLCRWIIDSATGEEKNWDLLIGYIGGLLGLILFQTVGRLLCRWLEERIRTKTEMSFKSSLFRHLLDKDYAYVSRYHSGELMNRLTNDVVVVSDGITSMLPSLFALLTRLICAVCVLIAFDRNFTLIFLAGGLLIFLVSRIFRKKLKELHKKVQTKEGKVRSFVQETLSNMAIVKAFNIQEKQGQRADALQQDLFRARIKRRTIGIFANAGFGLVFQMGYLFALVWGAFQLFTEAMSFGSLTAILQLVGQIQQPFSSLSGFLPRYYSVIASAERLLELENLPDEKDGENTQSVNELYTALQTIHFDDLTFRYDRDIVLDNANLILKKYDFAAIEGISGVGKSTLLKLMLGLYSDYEGKIYFSTSASERISVDKSTRRLFGYVPQGNHLFSGSILENILLLRPDATQEQIEEALRISCSKEFICQLPDGLHTIIGENGAGLSEGQAQRLAIARMLLSGAPILLLDEATSALDETTEEQLLQNLKELHGFTLLIVSHKKAALKICNKIIRITEQKLTVTEK